MRPLELLGLVEEIKALDQPLSIAPDVIVLGILLEHCTYELGFALRCAQGIDDGVTVVPDLVVFEMLERGRIEPCDFVL